VSSTIGLLRDIRNAVLFYFATTRHISLEQEADMYAKRIVRLCLQT
jgi:hypothetical protein